jgi:hypothetical protein
MFQTPSIADGGILNFSLTDETSDQPVISRMELWRPDAQTRSAKRRERSGRDAESMTLMPVRKTVPAGIGFVLDRQIAFDLPDGAYQFKIVRGPEYRIIRGEFSLEKTSLDDHHVLLPRMVDMHSEGWVSGDCLVPRSDYNLPLRMVSEDLHVAAVNGDVTPRPIAGRTSDESTFDTIDDQPRWIRTDATVHDGLVIYNADASTESANDTAGKPLPVESLLIAASDPQCRIAIENPFAWPLPVWLATDRIDGVFVLGDWLRLDRKVVRVRDGRPVQNLIRGHEQAVGQWAETIYHQMLEAGLHVPPLAGSGDDCGKTPVGYNRVYAHQQSEQNESSMGTAAGNPMRPWWDATFSGRSCVTNGPCLRPKLDGQLPGHVFHAQNGDVLTLRPELQLAVRDPVDYLDVIHNGVVRYSARLDEFARAGGQIPPLEIKESGWVMVRVVTAYPQHLRAAWSAPWYIVFDDQPRITKDAVEFFSTWLREYEQKLKQLPADQIKRHVPHVQKARRFWANKRKTITVAG